MNCTRELEIRIFKKAALILFVLIIIALFLRDSSIIFGLAAGFFIGVFHFKMIASSVKRLTNISSTTFARIFCSFGCFFRFMVLGVLFWLASTRGLMFFLATAVGFLTIKISVILEGLNKSLSWKT